MGEWEKRLAARLDKVIKPGWLRATYEYADGHKVVVVTQEALYGDPLYAVTEIDPNGADVSSILADQSSAVSLMAPNIDGANLRKDDKRLGVKNVAGTVSLSVETLNRYRRAEMRGGARKGPPWHEHPIGSGRYWYWQSEVIAWMENGGRRQ